MKKYTETGVLIECNECFIEIKKKIDNGIHIEFQEEFRKDIIQFLIFIYSFPEIYKMPQSTRKSATDKLLAHGQFSSAEINESFESSSKLKSSDFTEEFEINNPNIDLIEYIFKLHRNNLKNSEYLYEKHYYPQSYSCDERLMIGVCCIDVERIQCPTCKRMVENFPSNVSIGYDKHLICSSCINHRQNEFDTTGIVKVGNPAHHGEWITQDPEFHFSGTDYFFVTHNDCKNSSRDDKKGVMTVNGIWFDDAGRVVLSLQCETCGCTNALKPFLSNKNIPLLNESGAQWRRIPNRVDDILSSNENGRREFKSSLRWSHRLKKNTSEVQYEVVRTIAGFLNSNGGDLVIGVGPDKTILGLEADYATLKQKGNSDGFENLLTDVIKSYIGDEFRKYLDVSFYEYNNKEICVIEIEPSNKPAFNFDLNKNSRVFNTRLGNRTQELDQEKTFKYIDSHWNNN